jgi:hypothetical protein
LAGYYRYLPRQAAATHHYFDKLLAGNRAGEEKLAYYRQMTATAPRRYLKRYRLKYAQYIYQRRFAFKRRRRLGTG